jgi:hypothetical protein
MGVNTQNQRLAGNAAARLQAAQGSRQGIEQRRAAIRAAGQGEPETGPASMFPNEVPGPGTPPPGMPEEAVFRRQEITRERDRSGRREEMFRDFQNAAAARGETSEVTPGGAVERGAGIFGAAFGGAGQAPRSGIAFGPGRANRMPDANTPEYQQLVARMRGMGR